MEENRVKVKSPNAEVYERVREIVQGADSLVLENPRRLSLSVRNPSIELVQRIEQEGATVSADFRYDLEAGG
jgi:hypothetical protein